MKLWTFSVREVRRRPGRTALTLLSVVLGVASVVAVTTATDATRRAYQDVYRAMTGRAALEVATAGGTEFDQSILDVVAATPGVAAAAPVLQRATVVYLADDRVQVSALGIDPDRDAAIRDYELASGSFFVNGGGVLLDADFARNVGLELNQNIRLLTKRGPRDATIVGLLQPSGAAAYSQGGTIFLPLKAAQSLFGAKGKIDAIHLVLADPADEESVRTAVAAQLPPGVRVRRPTARTQFAEQLMLASEQGLRLSTALSLVVSLFLVLNTFLMNVGERRRQLAILRAIGATRRQVVRLLLAEGLALGLAGSVLGVLAGLAGARLLTAAMAELFRTAVPDTHIAPGPCLLGLAFGLCVSLAGTYIPARKAGRVSPLEGMSHLSPEELEGPPRLMTAVGLVIVVLSLLTLRPIVAGRLSIELSAAVIVVSMVGMVLLAPLVLAPLSRGVSALLSPLLRIEGGLARRQLLRRRVRSGLTVGVLFVSIGAGIGLGSAIFDNVDDVQEWYRRTFAGDFFVRAFVPDMTTGASAEMPESLRAELAAIPGVAHLETVRFFRTIAAGESAIVLVREFSADRPLHLDLTAGSPVEVRDRLAAGEAVLGTVLAQQTGLGAGDEFELGTPNGPRRLRIAATANDYAFGGLVLYLDQSTGRALLNLEGVDAFIVQADPNSREAVETALHDLTSRHGLLLQSFAQIAAMIDGMQAGVVACLYALLALGFVVAAFGIVNTLTMNVLEQTRELGLLRIVAMTRWQVRKMILAQALIMGLVGLGPGTLAGIGIAYLIHLCTLPLLGHPIDFVARPMLVFCSLAAGLAIVVAAAWMPAERAARIELAAALQYE